MVKHGTSERREYFVLFKNTQEKHSNILRSTFVAPCVHVHVRRAVGGADAADVVLGRGLRECSRPGISRMRAGVPVRCSS